MKRLNGGRCYPLSVWLSGVEKVKAQCYYVMCVDDNYELWVMEYNTQEAATQAAAEIRQAVEEGRKRG